MLTNLTVSRRALHSAQIGAVLMMGAVDAPAQVSLGGRVDLTVAKSSPGIWQVAPGGSSRLVFRAQDDLGGGLLAYAYAQHRFNADDGTPKAPFWYSTYTGLRHAQYGDVRLGYQASPIDDATGSHYEVWDGDTLASRFSSIAGGTKIQINTVRYTTPEAFGFRVSAAEMPSEGTPGLVRGKGASLLYDQGGFSAALSVQRNPSRVFNRGIGGRYVTEQFRLFATWADGNYVNGNRKQVDLQLSGGYKPTPAGEIRVLYNKSRLATTHTTLESVGYFYWLSKRTALLANVSLKKVDKLQDVKSWQAGLRVDF